jgi:hypothetical protein
MQETQSTVVGDAQYKRVWPKLSMEVYADLDVFAKEEKRTASEMAAIFIENAIKERKRKRNGKAKDNT